MTLTLPSYCKTGSGSITWCTRSLGTNRYGLYRIVGATCTGGVKWADYLVSSSTASCSGALCIFSYTAQSTDIAGQAPCRPPGEREALDERRALRADRRHRAPQQHSHLKDPLDRGTPSVPPTPML